MNPLVGRPRKSPRFADVHRVISLEGVGALRRHSFHSDKEAPFTAFDRKRLFASVRTAIGRRAHGAPPLLLPILTSNAPPSPARRLSSSEYEPRPLPPTQKTSWAVPIGPGGKEGYVYAKPPYTPKYVSAR